MICQNCHTEVDDDLIFCTNCGERLFGPQEEEATVLLNDRATRKNEAETVLLNDPRETRPEPAKPPKSSSNLKWVALIVALVAIPLSIFGLLLLQSRNRPVTQGPNRPASPPPTPSRKPTANQNANVNQNANANRANVNTNANATPDPDKTEVIDERIEIAPKKHYAVPFEIEDQNARLIGEVTVLEGPKIEVFVYIKSEYDTYFPDPNHKVSSFETRKSEEFNQLLVEEEYVLVFVNNSDKPVTVQSNFSIKE